MVPDARSGGPHFAAFCERYVRHTKGRWARQPFVLEEWQREFMWEALEIDPAAGLRLYEEVDRRGRRVHRSPAGPLGGCP